MPTSAVSALAAAGVDHHVVTYEVPEHVDGFGVGVVDALGLDPDATGKTLIVRLDDGRLVAAVLPVSSMLDLKALARLAGSRKAAMADPAEAERATGMVTGGIAPLGHRRPLARFVDTSLAARGVVHVSGGRRGLELTLSGPDLVAATDATVGSLTT